MQSYMKTGYLNSNFRMFHLKDEETFQVDYHFHDFHKILIILSGTVSYSIEGRSYALHPNDIVFVHAGEVHKPILTSNTPYERIIIYVSKRFLEEYQTENNDLSLCLKQAHQKQSHVLRIPSFQTTKLGRITQELEQSFHSTEYANELYHDILFLEFMIQLNRIALAERIEYIPNSSSNQKMIAILDYLNAHLTEEISIDSLAETFFTSRYYLMHSFKEETGYTIGNYITTKRLLYARELIDNGTPITEACYACGFRNYSSFSRAYKKHFHCNPRNHLTSNVPQEYS